MCPRGHREAFKAKVDRTSDWTIVQKSVVMHQESAISGLEIVLNPDS